MAYYRRFTGLFLNTFSTKTPVKFNQKTESRLMSTSEKKEEFSLVTVDEARRFIEDCLIASGTCKRYAEEMADVLVVADCRGHYSHGMNRLEMYVNDIGEGRLCPNGYPTILKENSVSAWVDGNNGLGGVIGNFCMKLAIQKARCSGIGWVAVKGSNHFGMNSYYSLQAMRTGMVGLTFTNTVPFMCPTRAKQAALGTNPLSISAPGLCGESIVLDMATTAVSAGKIEVQKRKGQPIPSNWALGPDGEVTTDPNVALKASALLPLGGLEETSGYKGYGLALVVEILCGIMAGASYGQHITSWQVPTKEPQNLGQAFAAIDPECFAPGFQNRITDIVSQLRKMPPVNNKLPVLVAGDKEKASLELTRKMGGIMYVEDQIKTCSKLALKLDVCPLRTRNVCGCSIK